ncbi:MAG: imidazole glycerol phosphate synthase subunit HisH [Azoarcus sp.]|jgi:glutamine amidotransferase|nr:imidazole glycerol phosphate synthase subunit HisH [Azoarcus sp.]
MGTVAIIDYGMGNLHSVAKAVERIAPAFQVEVTADAARVAAADRVVFPGQGSMPDCMRELDLRGLRPVVLDAAASKPFLGICIGLQMLFGHSDEGDVPGLGVFAGNVARFPGEMFDAAGARLKVPHMGWNRVYRRQPHPLWEGIPDGDRFYFVHSYCVQPANPAMTVAETDHGVRFTSAVGQANIFAVQFHPEKSARAGLRLLSNFIHWTP